MMSVRVHRPGELHKQMPVGGPDLVERFAVAIGNSVLEDKMVDS